LSLPDYTTIDRWLTASEELRQRYARAKEAQADYMADEMMQIADNTTDPQKARLQLDTRKWLAAKLKPKKYGDKQTVENTGPDGGPQEHKWTVEVVSCGNDQK
jgi:hypothetical protein